MLPLFLHINFLSFSLQFGVSSHVGGLLNAHLDPPLFGSPVCQSVHAINHGTLQTGLGGASVHTLFDPSDHFHILFSSKGLLWISQLEFNIRLNLRPFWHLLILFHYIFDLVSSFSGICIYFYFSDHFSRKLNARTLNGCKF